MEEKYKPRMVLYKKKKCPQFKPEIFICLIEDEEALMKSVFDYQKGRYLEDFNRYEFACGSFISLSPSIEIDFEKL